MANLRTIIERNSDLTESLLPKPNMATREIAVLDAKIDYTTDESVAATRRIKDIAIETHELGVGTAIKLNEQGERLERVEDTAETMELDVQYARYQASYLDTCGCCYRCFHRRRRVSTSSGIKNETSRPVISSQPSPQREPRGAYIKPVLDNDPREAEIERNLRETGRIVDDLEGLAGEIGLELDRQNELIPKITDKVNKVTVDINDATDHLRGNLK